MKIEEAKAIPLVQILERIGLQPTKQKPNEAWYLSPFRNEKTPSFKIHTRKNLWYDFGETKGGDPIEFVRCYLKSTNEDDTVSDALRWIKNMAGFVPIAPPFRAVEEEIDESKILIRNSKEIEHAALKGYLKKRGIPLHFATKHLKELRLHNKETDKSFFALGFKNDEGGHEIRNPFFKGCIRPKYITFIRGSRPETKGIHLFEGFMDYLTVLTIKDKKNLEEDVIVLNSVSCLKHATPYIKSYGYTLAMTWMDNDTAGKKATKILEEFFQSEENLKHIKMNNVYAAHNDVNAWHMHNLGL